MPDIVIRKVSKDTTDRLRRRAKRRGKTLQADLRETLDTLARQERAPTAGPPFGTWLVALSRPGASLDDALATLRSATARPVDFD